jgi:hypothetical protein
VPLLEGQNDFTFWALSSWGDSSLMGTASGKVDTQPPTISGSVSGTAGDNGWFISSVILTASASDPAPGSGLSAFEYSLNGDGWTACTGSLTLADGSHTVNLRAVDVAGNTGTASQSVHVDSEPPQVSLTGNIAFCPACGESLAIAFSAQDNTSGISSWNLSSGGAILTSGSDAASAAFTWDGGGFPAGAHTLTIHASDQAGNAAEINLDVTILAPTPTPVPPRPVSPTSTADVPFVYSSPTPTATASPAPLPSPTFTPSPTRTASAFIFGGATPTQMGGVVPSNPNDQPVAGSDSQAGILWGAAAAAAIGAATAYALEQRRKRKEEEAREQAKAREEVARRNAEREAARVRNWLAAEAARKEAALLAVETADMTEAEKLAAYKQTDRYKSYQEKLRAWEAQQEAQVAIPAEGTPSLPTPRKDKGLTETPSQPGKGGGLASLAAQGALDGDDPWWKKVWNKFKNWVTGGTTPTATPTRTFPTPQVFITPAPTSTLLPPTSTPLPTASPTPAFPDGMGKYSSYWYGKSFYDMLDSAPSGWWQNYQGQPFSMKTNIAVVYNYEVAIYSRNSVVRDYLTEAFARRYWQSQIDYGPDGAHWYLGGRDMVRLRVLNGAPGINETDYDMKQAFIEANRILTNPEWQQGISWSSPYDWGNPNFTADRIQQELPEFWQALVEGKMGKSDDQILYISPSTINLQVNGQGVSVPEFFIVTKGQSVTLCDNRSCVNP